MADDDSDDVAGPTRREQPERPSGWFRRRYKDAVYGKCQWLIEHNPIWFAVFVGSVSATAIFFLLADGTDFNRFMETLLALIVGGTISAAASYKIAGQRQLDGTK